MGESKLCAIAISVAITACVATASPPPSRGIVVNGPPPAPLHEVRSAPPAANAVWVDGYWHWSGSQYAWIPGHWENAPPGEQWYGPQYVTTDGTTTYVPGGWKRTNANALH